MDVFDCHTLILDTSVHIPAYMWVYRPGLLGSKLSQKFVLRIFLVKTPSALLVLIFFGVLFKDTNTRAHAQK